MRKISLLDLTSEKNGFKELHFPETTNLLPAVYDSKPTADCRPIVGFKAVERGDYKFQ